MGHPQCDVWATAVKSFRRGMRSWLNAVVVGSSDTMQRDEVEVVRDDDEWRKRALCRQ